ncbi:MAG: hypothetical protein JWM18_2254 [Chloroflexi bacterium]|jgi:hypothetical protein|nr:hypothetical protein [Chloroflexota bacterium]
MLSTYLKGVAALSTAGLLLFGAGSAARADLAPPSAPGVDSGQAQQPAPDPGAYAPIPSDVQNAPGTDARDSGNGPSAAQAHDTTPQARNSTPSDGTVITPAPPSSATANVVNANIIDTCISCTSASAGAGGASAHATAIRLLGNDIAAGKAISGSGEGKDAGALLAIPANPLLELALADWEEHSSGHAASSSHSRASLIDLAIGPSQTASGGIITLAVLEATSNATYEGLSSQGSGANNGVDLNVGQGALVLILLHSDASSSNKGSAYVVGINGTQLVSSDQTGPSGIPISVPGIVGLVLLQVGASGGNGSTGAAVGTVSDLLGQSGQQAGVLTASAVGLTGLQATPNAGTPPATGTAAAVGAGSGLRAPNTGTAFGLGGLLLLLSGGGLAAASLRRRDAR